MFFRIARSFLVIVVSFAAAHFAAIPVSFVLLFFLDIGGSFMGGTIEYYMFGFPLAGSLFLGLLFSAFGDKYKLWWIGIALLPLLWFELQLASILIVFSAVLVLVGLWLGAMVNKALWKLMPKFMAKIG